MRSNNVRAMRHVAPSAVLAAAIVGVLWPAGSTLAASANFTGTTNGVWATTTNWSASPVPGSGDTATFNSAGGGNTTLDLGGGVTIASLVFNTSSAAAYTIGSGGVGVQTLTLNNGSGTAGLVTINSTVTNDQLINANVVLGTDRAGNTSTLTNASTAATLTLAGNVTGALAGGTAGNKTLAVAGAGNIVIRGAIATGGANSVILTKSGFGTLTLSGASTYAGATTVNAGKLALDFSAAGAPTINILNNTANSSGLTLNSGALDITLSNGATANTQRFNGITFGSGASGFRVIQNGNSNAASGVTLAGLTRSNNSTADFTLPTTGTITTTSTSAFTGTNKVLTSSTSAAYATHGATDWVVNNTGTFGTTAGLYSVNTFTASSDVDITADSAPTAFTVNTLRFNTSGKTLTLNNSGNSVVTAGGILVTAGGTGSVIASGGSSAALTSGTSSKEVIVHNYGDLALNAPVVNNGANVVVFTHAGTGTTTLNAVNTHTGSTVLNSGVLKLGTGAALGSGTLVTRSAGANGSAGTLDLNGNSFSHGASVTNNGLITNSGSATTLTLNGSGNTGTGAVTGAMSLILSNGTATSSSNFGGSINPTGTITNSGTGTGAFLINGLIGPNVTGVVQNSLTSALTLTATAANGSNTFGGDVAILAGTLNAAGAAGFLNPLGTGTVLLGATSGSNPATLTFDQTGTVTNGISVRAGSSGVLTIRAVNTSGSISNAGPITLNNNLVFDTSATQNGNITFSGGITGTGNVDIKMNTSATGGPTLILGAGALNFTGALANNGTGNRSVSITAPIGANVTSITQDSATSSLGLSGNNSAFLGPIYIKAGTLSVSTTSTSLGGGSSAVQLGSAGSADAGLTLVNNLTYARAINVLAGDGLRTIQFNNNVLTSGAVTLSDDLRYRNTAGSVATISGGVTGTGNLTFLNDTNGGSPINVTTNALNHVGTITNAGTGTASTVITSSIGSNVTGITQNSASSALTLSGNNSGFAGSLNVAAGLMTVSTSNSLNNSAIAATVNGTLRLDNSGTAATIAGLSGAGAVYGNPGTGTATLNVAGTGTHNFTGVISDDNNDAGAKVLSLNKTGAGTQTLSGSNTYTGATSVNGGTLLVNGSLAAGSAVAVNTGAILGGNGTINGNVAVNSGGTLAPGNSPDVLEVGGNVNFASGSVFAVEINGLTPGDGTTGYDQLQLNGASGVVNLNNATLLPTFSFVATVGVLEKMFIINNVDTARSIGASTFNGLVDNAFVTNYGGKDWYVTYSADAQSDSLTGGNDVAIYSAVPEPTTLAVLGLGAMGLLRRRRAASIDVN